MTMIRKFDRFGSVTVAALLLVALMALSGCEKAEKPETAAVDSTAVAPPKPAPRPIVILYSYSPIGAELKQKTAPQSDTVWAGREIFLVTAKSGPVVLANSGVGMANAAATTQFLIDRYRPAGIVFCGIASAVNPGHQIGDLVIPESYITFDHGYWGEQGFLTDSVTVGFADSAGFDRMLEIPVDRGYYDWLGEAANAAAFRLRAVGRRLPEIHRGGIAISGSAFLDHRAKRDQLYKQLKAQITDTESAAVVQTAYAAGVPVAVLRACAAPAGESTSPQAQARLSDFFAVAAHNVALVIEQFLTPSEE